VPIEREADLVAGDDFSLADVDVGLAVEGAERGGFDEEASLAVENCEVGEEGGEEGSRPFETVGLGPVPVMDVSAVGAVFDDPALVALAVTSHCDWIEGLENKGLGCFVKVI